MPKTMSLPFEQKRLNDFIFIGIKEEKEIEPFVEEIDGVIYKEVI